MDGSRLVTEGRTSLADAHVHFFQAGFAMRYGRAWARPDELHAYEALRQAHRIDRALVVGYEGEEIHLGNNRTIAAWARRHPWMSCLAYVQEKRPAPALVGALRASGFVGISLYCLSPDAARSLLDWPASTIRALNDQGAIVSINATVAALEVLDPLLARLDRCQCLISHLGLPGRWASPPSVAETSEALRPLLGLAGHTHIGVKLSGVYALTDPSHAYPHRVVEPIVAELMLAFGGERLYWGSDYPACLEHISFAQAVHCLADLGIEEELRRRIMGENLQSLLAQFDPLLHQEPEQSTITERNN